MLPSLRESLRLEFLNFVLRGIKENPVKPGEGTSLAVQWLRFRASTAGGTGSIPGQGTKIPHAKRHGQKNQKTKQKKQKPNLGRNIPYLK